MRLIYGAFANSSGALLIGDSECVIFGLRVRPAVEPSTRMTHGKPAEFAAWTIATSSAANISYWSCSTLSPWLLRAPDFSGRFPAKFPASREFDVRLRTESSTWLSAANAEPPEAPSERARIEARADVNIAALQRPPTSPGRGARATGRHS